MPARRPSSTPHDVERDSLRFDVHTDGDRAIASFCRSEGEGHTFESCRVRHLHQSTLSRLTGCVSTLPRSHSDLRIRRIHTKVDVDPEADINWMRLAQIPAGTSNKIRSPHPERRQIRDKHLILRLLRIKRSACEHYDLNAGVVLRSTSMNNPGGRFIGVYDCIAVVAKCLWCETESRL